MVPALPDPGRYHGADSMLLPCSRASESPSFRASPGMATANIGRRGPERPGERSRAVLKLSQERPRIDEYDPTDQKSFLP
jgi:hypothetical protein